MKAITAYMANRTGNRENDGERRNEHTPYRREYENRSEYMPPENRVYNRQPNQYTTRSAMDEDRPEANEMRRRRDSRGRYMTYDGGAENRYRGRDGRWKSGTRRSEYDGGEYDNYPTGARMGDDDDEDDEDEGREYGVRVIPKNVIEWPYGPHMPPESRMIGFGNRTPDYMPRNHYGSETEHGMSERGMAGMHHDGTFDKKTMERWVNHMRDDKDKPIEPWSVDEVKPLAMRFGYPTHGEKFDDFFAAIHMMKSDFCAVAEDFDVNTPAFYAALADAWLKDPDAAMQGRDKLETYYTCIIKGMK